MINISVEVTVLHPMVDDKVTLALKLPDGTYVNFPIYDESFPLVKAGKKFRLTLEEVRNEDRLASYPDPEIEAHRKHLQEVIMPEVKKVEGMITETDGEVDEVVNKGPFCDGCKHIGVNTESGPCNVCFEGMMYESDK